jgi:hypothetical protein
MTQYTDEEIELAKRIYCATISVKRNMTFLGCWRKLISPHPERVPARIYLETAKSMLAIYDQSLDKTISATVEKP